MALDRGRALGVVDWDGTGGQLATLGPGEGGLWFDLRKQRIGQFRESGVPVVRYRFYPLRNFGHIGSLNVVQLSRKI